MGSVDKIRDYANKIENEKSRINEFGSKMKTQQRNSNRWWKSESGEAFRLAYGMREKELEKVQGLMQKLRRSLRELAVDVQNAEEERKREQQNKRTTE